MHTELRLEGAAREPHLRAGGADGAVLEEHGHDGLHGQAVVRQFRIQLLLASLRVRNALAPEVAREAEGA
eukprot:12306451-Heterocapsa_arctica.AAC.1